MGAMPLTSSDVRDKRFSTSRLRLGYVQEDVDALLRRVEETLRALEQGTRPTKLITASDVMRAQFRTTVMRPGYDEEEVDAFLDEIAETLRELGLYSQQLRTGKHSAEYFRREAAPKPREPVSPRMRPEDIRNKGFHTTRLRIGYSDEEVDAFLDLAEATVAALVEGRPQEARLTASQVRGVRFSSTRFRPGYVEEEVDAFLDEIADELERYGLH
ncbi:MAG: DivIVA domain-containing protein [Thermobifida fusca]|uniref:DivIVA domain-containing protein n=1 Tax=Thermobifida TaxID=83677 RepID=UPI000CEE9DDE|nr:MULTISPECIES: DivIVA domain-containing protein [Thermobifida]MBO2528899.1 hypothetical protein [Thermobifida sp.]PPS95240.1 hypothetical protein BH05_03435 [Thermobifida fusca]PZN66889.1 MAG: DivIVA domain-containing protein [Thermobifida fusca]